MHQIRRVCVSIKTIVEPFQRMNDKSVKAVRYPPAIHLFHSKIPLNS